MMAQYPTSTLEASKMLEAALEQMDGIIQGTKYEHPSSSTANQQTSFVSTNDINLNISNTHANYRTTSSSNQPNVSELLDCMRRLHIAIQDIPDDTCLRLSVRERDIEDAVYSWIDGRRRKEGIGRKDLDDIKNFNYEVSTLEDRIGKLEEQNHVLNGEIFVKNNHIADLEKMIIEERNRKQYLAEKNVGKNESGLNLTEGLDTGCGEALNTSATSTGTTPAKAALQAEQIQLKNRCEELERENLELRKLCGGNRTPKYLDLSHSNRRHNNSNMISTQLVSSPNSGSSVSDHEMSPIEHQRSFPNESSRNEPSSNVANTNNSSPKSSKGLRRIFSKIKRSNSGGTIGGEQTPQQIKPQPQQISVQQQPQPIILQPQNVHTNPSVNAFSRGGRFRATTGGHRFKGISLANSVRDPNTTPGARRPFNHWTLDMLSIWMDSLGLGMYDNHLKLSGIRNGENLASMHGHELESKLGMKTPLHRKKLILAIASRQESTSANSNMNAGHGVTKKPGDASIDAAGKLDHLWVTRWLDDIGLPQYKESFLDARVDGRVLNVLTVDDLIFELGVGSLLHHLSIRRAIQVLRQNNFDANCLKRRSSPEENDR